MAYCIEWSIVLICFRVNWEQAAAAAAAAAAAVAAAAAAAVHLEVLPLVEVVAQPTG